MMPRLLLCTVLCLTVSPVVHAAAPAAPTMTRLVTRVVYPLNSAGFFGSAPVHLVRSGTRFARIEGAPAAPPKGQLLVIAAEPDVWEIDLTQKKGSHVLDTAVPAEFHAPIFAPRGDDLPKAITELEFGTELDFFKAHKAKADGKVKEVDLSGFRIFLEMNPATHAPARLRIFWMDKRVFEVEYVSYELNLPFDATVFQPPADVEISGSKPAQ